MSTSNKFGLSQFALLNIKTQSGLSQVCKLYKNNATTATSMASMPRNSSNYNEGRVTKLIGVKKTLVNQMQGMAQSSRPKIKSRAMTQAISSKYSIYGQTKLFSSVSSLHGRSSSSGISPALNHRRCLSNTSPNANPARYIVHQQYHQSSKLQEKRNEDIARDISQSIKSELMDVDSNTKRLISCSRPRYANAKKQKEDNEGEQQMQRQKVQKTLTSDPLEGWNHPRAVKTIDSIKLADNDRAFDLDIVKQHKPLRRKSRNIRYKDESNVSVNQQFVQPSLQNRKLQAQLGELYVKTTNHNNNNNSKVSQEQQQQHLDDDPIMSVSPTTLQMNNNVLVAGEDRFKQNLTERDFIDHKRLSSKNEDGEISRMDEQYYQSKMAANLMSASQRVINNRFEETSDSHNKLKQIKLAKNMVQTVNPFPISKASLRPPPAPKSRPKTLVRSKDPLKSSLGKGTAQLWKRPKSEPVTILERYGEHYMDKLVDKPKSSFSCLPFWKKKSSSEKMNFMPSTSQISQMQMGEQRQSPNQKDEAFGPENLQNSMIMPTEYTKESAVQRLGTFIGKQATSLYQQSLRARQ